MTQQDAELAIIQMLERYVKEALVGQLEVGKNMCESVQNFYMHSDGAIALTDRRAKKIYDATVEFNEHLAAYVATLEDELTLVNINLNQLLSEIEGA